MGSATSDQNRATVDPARVSQYWERQFAKNRADTSLWTNNQIIACHINQLITDSEQHHWLPWFFNCYLSPQVVFQKSLSICCGDAAHELALADTQRVKLISGFDISEGAVSQACAAFASRAIDPATYRFEVADANQLKIDDAVDLILSTGALHHVTDLEGLLSRLAELLTSDGYLILVEYVGPNRFQWREAQVDAVNTIVQQLDARYLRDGVRTKLGPPPLEDIIAIDPSEAVRSEDILPVLREYFSIEYLRDFNGTVMHPLYPLLNPTLTNSGAADFDSIVRMILVLEDQLIKAKVLSSDFVFAICRSRNKRGTSGGTAGKRQQSTAYIGYIDCFDDTCISGWAANRAAAEIAIRVDVFVGDELRATVRADAFREDLLRAGYGDGRHGFAANLTLPPRAGTVARLTVSGTNHVLASRAFLSV